MIRSLWVAGSAMRAQQLAVDTTAHNLANVNTPGFKAGRVAFQDLVYQETMPAYPAAGPTVPPGWVRSGTGVRIAAILPTSAQGMLQATDSPYDLALEGPGYFRVLLPGGREAYTRDGSFNPDGRGRLVNAAGGFLLVHGGGQLRPAALPAGATDVIVGRGGEVSALGADGNRVVVGTVSLARFPNPAGLEHLGGGLYAPTAAAGQVETGTPGAGAFGQVRQGYRELANVDLAAELVNLLLAQRAYQLGARAVRTADAMLELANGLRR